jgi:hypothetical protein
VFVFKLATYQAFARELKYEEALFLDLVEACKEDNMTVDNWR